MAVGDGAKRDKGVHRNMPFADAFDDVDGLVNVTREDEQPASILAFGKERITFRRTYDHHQGK